MALTPITRHAAVSSTNASHHAASVTNVAKNRALGTYTFDEIGAQTIDSVADDTFNTIYTPITDQAKHNA